MTTLSRRGLGLGLAGAAAALGVGALPLSLADEDEVLDALFDALLGVEGSPAPTPAEVDASAAFRAYVAGLPLNLRLQIRGLLRALEWRARVTAGARLTRLDRGARRALLQEMATSPLYPERLMVFAVRQLTSLAYYQHRATWTRLGYPGPLLDRGR